MLKDYSAFVKAVTSQAIAPLIEIRGW